MDANADSLANGARGGHSTVRLTELLWVTLLVGLGASAISVGINSLVDFGLLGGAEWLQERRLRFLVGYQAHEVMLGVFVHAFILEFSYLLALAVAAFSVTPRFIAGRGLSFVFLSFLFYEIWVLMFYPVWWGHFAWEPSDLGLTYALMVLPIPGACNYALRLLTMHAVARNRQINALSTVPWWSIFAPTVSFAMSAAFIFPVQLVLPLFR